MTKDKFSFKENSECKIDRLEFQQAIVERGLNSTLHPDFLYIQEINFTATFYDGDSAYVYLSPQKVEALNRRFKAFTTSKTQNDAISYEQLVAYVQERGEGISRNSSYSEAISETGFIFYLYHDIPDLYFLNDRTKTKYDDHLQSEFGQSGLLQERGLQRLLVGYLREFITILGNKFEMFVTDEVGVKTGKRENSREESRYDLVFGFRHPDTGQNERHFIELKKHSIDLGILGHKIGKHEMGAAYEKTGLHGDENYLYMIGSRVDSKAERLVQILCPEKRAALSLRTYNEYINEISDLFMPYIDNEIDKENIRIFGSLVLWNRI